MEAIDEKVKFVKQVPVHPRDRLRKQNIMKKKEGQITRDNVSKLMIGEFDFNPKKQKTKYNTNIWYWKKRWRNNNGHDNWCS